jgi:hypothetical protein
VSKKKNAPVMERRTSPEGMKGVLVLNLAVKEILEVERDTAPILFIYSAKSKKKET